MKKLLKFSSSSLVLIALLVAPQSVYAGNVSSSSKDPNNNNNNNEKRVTTPRAKTGHSELDFVLNDDETKVVGKEITPLTSEELKQYSNILSNLPQDLQHLIFSFMSFQDFSTIQLTCKHWRQLSLDYSDFLKKQPKFMSKLAFSNPRNFIWAYNKLAEKFPIENYPKILLPQTPNMTTTDVTPESETPEDFKDLIQSIEKFAPYKKGLTKKYIRIDLFDKKAVGFAASVVKVSPELQDILKLVVKSTHFNYEEIGKLMKNSQLYKGMQLHLMALKLLTLAGDLESKTALTTFDSCFLNRLYDLINKNAFNRDHSQLKSSFAYLADQPLWALYGDAEYTLGAQTILLTNFLNIYCNTRKNKPNIENLTKLADYTLAFYPNTKGFNIRYYTQTLSNFYHIDGQREQNTKILTQGAQLLKEGDPCELMFIASDLIDNCQYSDALKYLELALENAKNSNSLLHFQIKYYIVTAILESGDICQLARADTYLSEIFQEFKNQKKKKEIELPYESEGLKFDIAIEKGGLLELQSALYIYQGDFEKSIACLQEMKEPQLDISTLNALQTQINKKAVFPKLLLKSLSLNFKYIWEQIYKNKKQISKNIGSQSVIYDILTNKYPDVFSLLIGDSTSTKEKVEKITLLFAPFEKKEMK
ncbi:F-box-like protein [Candidatus Bealeia paramacronuclearis]|uniref:F-box-like protein n=1 Tax=Candidatus Bealeia paramacronuclearis TaxID=1921001 RepID=A0ABZ2C4C1_9PROT|nr:F-box-like protein [Candidatus Bealeia paramacronuclearis]